MLSMPIMVFSVNQELLGLLVTAAVAKGTGGHFSFLCNGKKTLFAQLLLAFLANLGY